MKKINNAVYVCALFKTARYKKINAEEKVSEKDILPKGK